MIHTENIVQQLLDKLLEIARLVIEDRPENKNFKSNPDDPKEHVVQWHQFGIITHTKVFSQVYKKNAQDYLKGWNLDSKVKLKLTEQIDGKSKEELLHISIVFHDLGKFARNFEEKNGSLRYNFYGHEAKSEKLIKEDKNIYNLLSETYKLTSLQIEYIGRCAGLHFELGKVRDAIRRTDKGYTIAFANSEACQQSCKEIANGYPEYNVEIGILYLCDSLAKTDVRIDADTDEEIAEQTEIIEQIIKERKLNPQLIGAIKQLPVNLAIARKYFENL
jgi:hypothetical protein